MLQISNNVAIPDNEIEITAIHLRFDVTASSLPDFYKEKLLKLSDQRINKEGIIIIKAQKYRSQEKNREEALERLQQLIKSVAIIPRKRIATKVSKGVKRKRLDEKTKHGKIKSLRQKVSKQNDY